MRSAEPARSADAARRQPCLLAPRRPSPRRRPSRRARRSRLLSAADSVSRSDRLVRADGLGAAATVLGCDGAGQPPAASWQLARHGAQLGGECGGAAGDRAALWGPPGSLGRRLLCRPLAVGATEAAAGECGQLRLLALEIASILPLLLLDLALEGAPARADLATRGRPLVTGRWPHHRLGHPCRRADRVHDQGARLQRHGRLVEESGGGAQGGGGAAAERVRRRIRGRACESGGGGGGRGEGGGSRAGRAHW